MTARNQSGGSSSAVDGSRKGMVLPFTPLSLAFDHVNYYVDMPSVSPFASYIMQMQDAPDQDSYFHHCLFLE